jgi:hypothetical protein
MCIMAALFLFLSGCGKSTNAPVIESISASATDSKTTPISTTPLEMTNTSAPTLSASPTHESYPTLAEGCQQPSDDYDRLNINGHILNARTYEMLEYAAELYQGTLDITGSAITQGSYTNAVEASFGTHAGGGVVDLSVMAPGTYDILYDEIEPLIRALRLAGFAAWFRDFNDLYAGSPVHIHAIAIGDEELSQAARDQLTGISGYFLGYNGLPTDGGEPITDPHGGPVICPWMIVLGYPEFSQTSSPVD